MKLLLDECIPSGISGSIAKFMAAAKPPVETVHMIVFTGKQGEPDDVWVPKAANEGWFVITGDSVRSKEGPPLHRLLPEHGVSAAFLSGKLQQKPGFEKVRAVISLLDALRDAAAQPRG